MEWEVSYVKEKSLFEIKYKSATGVIGLQDFRNLDPSELADYLTGILNELAVSN